MRGPPLTLRAHSDVSGCCLPSLTLIVSAFMNILRGVLILALVIDIIGCTAKKDRVVATYVFPLGTTTRMVLFNSGRYEQWLIEDGVPNFPFRRSQESRITLHGIETKVHRPPIQTGTWLMSKGRLEIAVSPDQSHPIDGPTRRVYHLVSYGGFEYLFDEHGGWAQKYQESHDTNLLRYAWRQEALTSR